MYKVYKMYMLYKMYKMYKKTFLWRIMIVLQWLCIHVRMRKYRYYIQQFFEILITCWKQKNRFTASNCISNILNWLTFKSSYAFLMKNDTNKIWMNNNETIWISEESFDKLINLQSKNVLHVWKQSVKLLKFR